MHDRYADESRACFAVNKWLLRPATTRWVWPRFSIDANIFFHEPLLFLMSMFLKFFSEWNQWSHCAVQTPSMRCYNHKETFLAFLDGTTFPRLLFAFALPSSQRIVFSGRNRISGTLWKQISGAILMSPLLTRWFPEYLLRAVVHWRFSSQTNCDKWSYVVTSP